MGKNEVRGFARFWPYAKNLRKLAALTGLCHMSDNNPNYARS